MSVLFTEKFDAWTVDDLPDDDRRYEIVDGSLIMSPAPTTRHDVVIARLLRILSTQLAEPDRVLGPAGLTFAPTSYRVPDLVVVRAGVPLWDAQSLGPADLELAVEVVSPSSVSTDRITKPAQYAAAGIPAYWRVETDPGLTLTVYTLREGAEVYTEIGHWAENETAAISEPFVVSFTLADLRG